MLETGGTPSELIGPVYLSLHGAARARLAHERRGHTLQPSDLIHEAYLKIQKRPGRRFASRQEFSRVASYMMSLVLKEYARSRRAGKRGGEWARVSLGVLDRVAAGHAGRDVRLIDLMNAVEQLDEESESGSISRRRLVELRWFARMTNEEAAEVLGVSASTVKRRWAGTRARILERLGLEGEG